MQLTLPSFDLPYRRHKGKQGQLRPFPFRLAPLDEAFLIERDQDCSLYDDPVRQAQGFPPPLRFFAGVCDASWNRWPTLAGPFVCVAPIHGKTSRTKAPNSLALAPWARAYVDSSAFSDADKGQRLTPAQSLERQYTFIDASGIGDQVIGISSYDHRIDEMWLTDNTGTHYRVKRRWTEQAAIDAVEETVKAAAYLSQHRDSTIPCILNLQGVNPTQYLQCAQCVLKYYRDGDIIGLGGWCITGRFPKSMYPIFAATMQLLIPFLAQEGIQRIHIWGLCDAEALGHAEWLCDRAHIALSVDSAMPAIRPVYGDWGYGDWHLKDYKQHRPPLHLSTNAYQNAGMAMIDEATEPVLRMHETLMTDEELAEEITEDDHRAWLLDPKAVETYLECLCNEVRTMHPEVYGQVRGYDGQLFPVIQAQGAYRIELVYQVRRWLAALHTTHWYRPF